jgi:hypothetical protein
MIEQADIDRLKEIFVTRKECDDTMDDVNTKLSNDMKELAVINTKLSLILWFLGAVGAAVITVLVKLFFGGKV